MGGGSARLDGVRVARAPFRYPRGGTAIYPQHGSPRRRPTPPAALGFAALVLITVTAAPIGSLARSAAGNADSLAVAAQIFGTGVDRQTRALTGEATEFPADVERIFCWTRITGAHRATQITHIWYHAGEPKAKVVLPIASGNWRTYSSKAILPEWSGRWEVAVLDAEGRIIGRAAFRIR